MRYFVVLMILWGNLAFAQMPVLSVKSSFWNYSLSDISNTKGFQPTVEVGGSVLWKGFIGRFFWQPRVVFEDTLPLAAKEKLLFNDVTFGGDESTAITNRRTISDWRGVLEMRSLSYPVMPMGMVRLIDYRVELVSPNQRVVSDSVNKIGFLLGGSAETHSGPLWAILRGGAYVNPTSGGYGELRATYAFQRAFVSIGYIIDNITLQMRDIPVKFNKNGFFLEAEIIF